MAFSMKLPAAKKPARASPVRAGGATQYGLVLPTKKDPKKVRFPRVSGPIFTLLTSSRGPQELHKPAAIFSASDNDESSRGDEDKAAARRRVGAEAVRSLQRAQIERAHEKALAEDASVFDYDGVYDSIQSARASQKRDRKAQRESDKTGAKYIATLVEKAKVREIEHERIRERRLLKERASEDALFGDKEKLVSASYKRKLQEMKRWDDADKRMDAMEAAEDVATRGGDAMAGFYANLLTKNLAMGGAAAHAKSAYTVGAANAAAVDEEAVETRREEPRKRARVEQKEEEEAEQKEEAAPERESSSPATESHASVVAPSRDEVISAARARFLARKAARQTPSTQSE
jgi:coiled-coil domain-containing protein 55